MITKAHNVCLCCWDICRTFVLMRRFIIILMTMLVCSVALFAAEQSDLRIHEFMKQVAGNVAADSAGVESLSARLYMRERIDVARKNWLLNIIPSMTHFDRDENEYVAELFYYVNCMYNSLPWMFSLSFTRSTTTPFKRGDASL